MHPTKVLPPEPSAPSLKNEVVAALGDGRVSVILCILTIFMAGFCAAHLAKDVLDARPMITFMAPDGVVLSKRG